MLESDVGGAPRGPAIATWQSGREVVASRGASDGRALVVDLCDTVEHMRANERNGFYQTQVAKFAGKLVDRPAREFYDVAVAKGVKGGAELLRDA